MSRRENGSAQENMAELDVTLDTAKEPGGLGGPAIRRVVTTTWNKPWSLATVQVSITTTGSEGEGAGGHRGNEKATGGGAVDVEGAVRLQGDIGAVE